MMQICEKKNGIWHTQIDTKNYTGYTQRIIHNLERMWHTHIYTDENAQLTPYVTYPDIHRKKYAADTVCDIPRFTENNTQLTLYVTCPDIHRYYTQLTPYVIYSDNTQIIIYNWQCTVYDILRYHTNNNTQLTAYGTYPDIQRE